MGEKAESGMMREFWPDSDLGFPSTKMEKAVGKATLGGEDRIPMNLLSSDVDWSVRAIWNSEERSGRVKSLVGFYFEITTLLRYNLRTM